MNKEQIDQLAQRCWLGHENDFDHHKFLAEVDKLRAEQENPVAWRQVTGYLEPFYLYHGTEPARGKYEPLFLRHQPIPEGYMLLKDSTYEERSWPEDYSHENGNYTCSCCNCGRQFTGYKRRVTCKVCATTEEKP